MAKIPLAVLDQLVAGEVGGTGEAERIIGERLNPISVTIREAVSELSREVAVYMVYGGLPEFFSIPGFDPAAVSFSTRCVEVGSTLLRLVESSAMLGNSLIAVSKQVCLEIMAELALKNGDCAAAVYLISEAVLASPVIMLAPSTIGALEMEEYGETYMAVWFYGLLHELGHVHAEQDPGAGDMPVEAIQQLIESAFPDRYMPQVGEARAKTGRHPLSDEHLRTEVTADRFAADIMWRATKAVLDMDGRADSFNPVALALVILDMFDVLAILTSCKLAAEHMSRLGADIWDRLSVNLANQVRLNGVVRHMAELLAVNEVPAAGSVHDADSWLRALAAMYTERRGRFSHVDEGMEQAMHVALRPWEHEPDESGSALAAGLRERHGDRVMLSSFLDLARRLSLDHPDLRKLDAIKQAPDAGSGRSRYLMALAHVSGRYHLPVGVDSQYGYLLFAFVPDSLEYAQFRGFAAIRLPPDMTLQDAEVKCEWQYELTALCTRGVPDDQKSRTRVVVEGTPLFDRLKGELTAGTIRVLAE